MSARDPRQELRDPLGELKDALSFPVSPDFCARVRQQVATEPVRSRIFGGQVLALTAAIVLAAGIAATTTLRHRDVDRARVSSPRGIDITKPLVQTEREPVAAIESVRVVRQSAGVAISETVKAFETVVPDDQLHALDRLLAAMREGRATVPPVVADRELNDRGERVLRALVIEPVTVELLAGTPAEATKNPVKNPNK